MKQQRIQKLRFIGVKEPGIYLTKADAEAIKSIKKKLTKREQEYIRKLLRVAIYEGGNAVLKDIEKESRRRK